MLALVVGAAIPLRRRARACSPSPRRVAAALSVEGGPEEILHPLNLTALAIDAACGLGWWAYLPSTGPDPVRVFE